MPGTFVVRRFDTFHFRYKLPPRIQGVAQRRELRLSLRTGKKALALWLAGLLAGPAKLGVLTLERLLKDAAGARLTPELMQELLPHFVRYAFRAYRDAVAEVLAHGAGKTGQAAMFLRATAESFDHDPQRFLADRGREPGGPEQTLGQPLTKRVLAFLDEAGVNFDALSPDFFRALALVCPLGGRIAEALPASEHGLTPEAAFPDLFPAGPAVVAAGSVAYHRTAPRPDVAHLTRVADAIRHFWGLKRQGKAGRTKSALSGETLSNYAGVYEAAAALAGDALMCNFGPQEAEKLLDDWQRLPNDFVGRPGKYAGQTIEHVLCSSNSTKSPNRRNFARDRLSEFGKWATDKARSLWEVDPFNELRVEEPEKQSHLPWSNDVVRRVFLGENYPLNDNSHNFWVFIIALFTGARQNEICQLLVDDVKCDDGGQWYFSFTEDGDSKKQLKNKASRRATPMHEQLVELGLPDYVKALAMRGETRLFPLLWTASHDGKVNNSFKDWSSRFLRKVIGVEGYVFHGLRNTVTTRLADAGVQDSDIKRVVGHEQGDTLNQHYKGGLSMKALYRRTLARLDYGLDFSPLKASPFAGGNPPVEVATGKGVVRKRKA